MVLVMMQKNLNYWDRVVMVRLLRLLTEGIGLESILLGPVAHTDVDGDIRFDPELWPDSGRSASSFKGPATIVAGFTLSQSIAVLSKGNTPLFMKPATACCFLKASTDSCSCFRRFVNCGVPTVLEKLIKYLPPNSFCWSEHTNI